MLIDKCPSKVSYFDPAIWTILAKLSLFLISVLLHVRFLEVMKAEIYFVLSGRNTYVSQK